VGIGLSLVLELLALRRIGAALNAGLFATGPPVGFLWSLFFLGERSGAAAWGALGLCLVGAVAMALDRHAHAHVHPAVRPTHRPHGHAHIPPRRAAHASAPPPRWPRHPHARRRARSRARAHPRARAFGAG